ncbi:hypothetical protein VCHA53O466_140030 [Vibrio chagasii]|nr:hypothetical protein VCHA53O466_140030 [Vibrio chagasii]
MVSATTIIKIPATISTFGGNHEFDYSQRNVTLIISNAPARDAVLIMPNEDADGFHAYKVAEQGINDKSEQEFVIGVYMNVIKETHVHAQSNVFEEDFFNSEEEAVAYFTR